MVKIFKFNKEETVRDLYKKCNNLGMNPSYCVFIETEWNDIYVADNELERDDLTDIINIVDNVKYDIEDFKGEEFNMDSLETLIRYKDNSIIDINMWGEHYRFFNSELSINDIAPIIKFTEYYSLFGLTQEIGEILDEWNDCYEYKFRLHNNEIIRFDLQTGDIDKVDIESIINYYITEIKHKIDQDDTIGEEIKNDYKVLKSFIEGLVG